MESCTNPGSMTATPKLPEEQLDLAHDLANGPLAYPQVLLSMYRRGKGRVELRGTYLPVYVLISTGESSH